MPSSGPISKAFLAAPESRERNRTPQARGEPSCSRAAPQGQDFQDQLSGQRQRHSWP